MDHTVTLADIFKDRLLEIPDYQRGYSWEEQQWQDLISDLELLPPGRSHYTGTLVLQPQPDTTRLDAFGDVHKVCHIVDGQQRLTTIILLIDAIRRALVAESVPQAFVDGMYRRYIATADETGAPLFRLLPQPDAQEFWSTCALADAPSTIPPTLRAHRQLQAARSFFEDYLAQKKAELHGGFTDWLRALYLTLTQRLRVSLYLTDDEAEVGVIFEVMNNRGKPLSELEKVKNHLLYAVSKLHLSDEAPRLALARHINTAWSGILSDLSSADLVKNHHEDQLLRTHWLVTQDQDLRSRIDARRVRAELDPRAHLGNHKALADAVRSYVTSLRSCAVAYRDASAPDLPQAFISLRATPSQLQRIRTWSRKLHRIRVLAPFLPLLVAARRAEGVDGERYLAILKACERFAFRLYRLAGKRANTGQSGLHRLALDLERGVLELVDVADQLDSLCLRYYPQRYFDGWWDPDGEEFDWYHWAGLKYLLYEYEIHLADGREVKLPWAQVAQRRLALTIEHILPQTPTAPYWTQRFDSDAHHELVHDLGNLCLTQDNSSYSNKPFPDKAGSDRTQGRCYARSVVLQERELRLHHTDWRERDIKARRERLFAWARQRWAMPASAPDSSADQLLTHEDAP